MFTEFSEVTELAGSEITEEQLQRMPHRYGWAARSLPRKGRCRSRVRHRSGPRDARQCGRSLEAGDYSAEILGNRQGPLWKSRATDQLDAQSLPYADGSKDVIILFEAIYYVPDATRFVQECRRVLRPGGHVLVATANKDLWDFSPSPLSHRYYGAAELVGLFAAAGFRAEVYGYMPVEQVSWRQRIVRPVKRLAVGIGIMPKSLKGKRLLKRFVFGRMIQCRPSCRRLMMTSRVRPRFCSAEPDRRHKVLYCCATRSAG